MGKLYRVFKGALCFGIILTFILLYGLNAPKVSTKKTPYCSEVYLTDGSHGEIKALKKTNASLILNKKGEAHVYLEILNIEDALNYYNAREVFREQSEWGISVYAYSKRIKYEKVINGKKINMHVNVNKKNNLTKIGFPIIYGSY